MKNVMLILLLSVLTDSFSQYTKVEIDKLKIENCSTFCYNAYLSSGFRQIEGISIEQFYLDILFILKNFSIVQFDKIKKGELIINDYFQEKDISVYLQEVDSINSIRYFTVKGPVVYSVNGSISDITKNKLSWVYSIGIVKDTNSKDVLILPASSNFKDVNLVFLVNNLKKNGIKEINVLRTIKNYFSFLKFEKLDLVKKTKTKYLYIGNIENESDKIQCEIIFDTKKAAINIKTSDKQSWLYYAIKKYNL